MEYTDAFEDVYRNVFDIPTKIGGAHSRMIEGGKAIASGGYGCVFRPAIKCQGETNPRPNSISKLMKKGDAEKEMQEVDDARRILSSIPNYEKYFAVTDYHMCVPSKITKEDSISFNNECIGPIGRTFTEVNQSLNSYRAVISPDLGLDLLNSIDLLFTDFGTTSDIAKKEHLYECLINLNTTASDLLLNGISKMADKLFYHSDVKPHNIMTNYSDDLTKPSFTEMKLIDFGLAYDSESMNVNSFIAFNTPFSSFMFDDYVIRYVNTLLSIGTNLSGEVYNKYIEQLTIYLVDGFVFKNPERTHIPYMSLLGSHLYKMTDKEYSDLLRLMYISYCKRIILSFTFVNSTGIREFDIEKYWNEVYRFNLDIWGFLTIFLLLASNSHNNPDIQHEYKVLVNEYLYNNNFATSKIPVDSIVASLNAISDKFRALIRPDKQIVLKKPLAKTKKYRLKIVKTFTKSKPVSNKKPMSVVRKETVALGERSVITLGAKRKNCPKGYVRHRKDKTKCIKRNSVGEKPRSQPQPQPQPQHEGISIKGKRCPKGYVRHKTQKNRCVVKK